MCSDSKIKNIKAREILDSRGNPTVEVDLTTNLGVFQASVPSGVSKGKYEAVELRDGGERYHGMGVLKAINNVNKIIAPKLRGKDPTKQKEIDEFLIKLDGRENKSKLGANAILAVSMAVCRAGAAAKNLPLYCYIREIYIGQTSVKLTGVRPLSVLPTPSFNVINGGAHAGNELDFQEFMIVPAFAKASAGKPQVKSFSKALQIVSEIYQELKNIIKEKYIDLAINVGDEGGFAPPVRVPEEAMNLILEAAKNLGYQEKIKIILDVAASQFYINGQYKTKFGVFTSEGLLRYYSDLIQKYPVLGLEDPFAEDNWEAWQKLISNSQFLISKPLVIGDDLLATNPKRIKMAKEKKACNSMILKINQIGTVTETLEAAKLAKSFGWKIIVSHRSGETNDDFISDLAVGIGADFIKAGAPARGERVAKYNRLLKIEEELL
jgi:enolase